MTEPGAALAAKGADPRATSERPLLVCHGILKRFGRTPALVGVDLALRPGQIMAVTGESGSGKSTLMLCMSGILAIDEGRVIYGGRDLATMGEPQLTNLRLSDFGFVFQTGHLVPDMSAVENVAFPLMLRGVRRRAAEEEGRAWLDQVGVGELAERLPGDMSVGQSQRVAVARAMAIHPKIIFADEPTGALDSHNGAVVVDILVKAARQQGSAVVLVTHSDKVARVADSRVTMRDGAIVASVR